MRCLAFYCLWDTRSTGRPLHTYSTLFLATWDGAGAVFEGQRFCEPLHYAKLPTRSVEKLDRKLAEIAVE